MPLARDWHFGFETSRFRNFCQFFEGFGFGIGKFGFGKKVSVSVSKKFGLGKKSRFRFRKIWFRKKSLSIGFGQNFGIVIQCHIGGKTFIDMINKIPKPSLPHPKLSSISNRTKQLLWAGTSVKCEFSSSEVPLGFSLQRILKGQHWTRGQLVDKEFSNYIQHLHTFKHFQRHRVHALRAET